MHDLDLVELIVEVEVTAQAEGDGQQHQYAAPYHDSFRPPSASRGSDVGRQIRHGTTG